MIVILVSWFYIFALLYFTGYVFYKTLSNFINIGKIYWYENLWIGFVITIAYLQLLNIFFPIDYRILILTTLILVGGVLLFIIQEKFRVNRLINYIFQKNIIFKTLLYVLLLALFSYLASDSVSWYDTYLYHLNWVDWANSAPVVPGLANLHSRLGFNSSLLTFASLFDNWILDGKSSHVVVSFFASIISIQSIYILKNRNINVQTCFAILFLPLLAFSILTSGQMASLSVDFVSTIVLIAACLSLFDKRYYSGVASILLFFVLITIKQSMLIFSGAAIIFLIVKRKYYFFLKRYSVIYILATILMVGYFSRNIITSGWIIYPLPHFETSFDWTMPKERLMEVYDITKSWGRNPGENWEQNSKMNTFQWFPQWYKNVWNSIDNKIFIASILLLPYSFWRMWRSKNAQNIYIFVIQLASLISIVFNVLSSAQMRFVGIFVWTLFISTIASLIQKNNNLRIHLISVLIFLMLFMQDYHFRIGHDFMFKSLRWESKMPTEPVSIVGVSSEGNEITIKKPNVIDWCGNWELLCTPESVNIVLRNNNNIYKGFKYKEHDNNR